MNEVGKRGGSFGTSLGNFRVNAEEKLTFGELLGLLSTAAEAEEHSREDAIACYLSGGDGWRDAVKKLGGAFAEGGKLRRRKAD